MTDLTTVLDPARRRSLLQDLEGIGSDADAHERMLHVFLPLPSHAAALNPSKLIIRGERGAGKTALFHVLRELEQESGGPGAMFSAALEGESRWVEGFSEVGKAHPSTDVLDAFGANTDDDGLLQAFWFGHLVGHPGRGSTHRGAAAGVLSGGMARPPDGAGSLGGGCPESTGTPDELARSFR